MREEVRGNMKKTPLNKATIWIEQKKAVICS